MTEFSEIEVIEIVNAMNARLHPHHRDGSKTKLVTKDEITAIMEAILG